MSTPVLLEDPNDPGTYLILSMDLTNQPFYSGYQTIAKPFPTKLTWGYVGDRLYETGVDRGVLYLDSGAGVAWNGITGVSEAPSGGEAVPQYLDGVKYLNVASRKEFAGTIEAYTYPEEFAAYEGWTVLENGISVDEQQSKPFSFSYRTLIGNDIHGSDHGYKIHIVYNVLATPTSAAYTTVSDNASPLSFSWSFSTMAEQSAFNPGLAPLSHIVIDSTKTNLTQLRFIEAYIYGSYTQPSKLPTLDQMLIMFANPMVTLILHPNEATGFAATTESVTLEGDLVGRLGDGLYVAAPGSRFVDMVGLDGGNATSTYADIDDVNGGNATSDYTGLATYDGGIALSTFTGLKYFDSGSTV